MKFYHSTTREAADAILQNGFRDNTDHFMTTTLHTGVWLSDVPLDENEGASSEALLCVECDESRLAPFEWKHFSMDGEPLPRRYREFLVPAEVVNTVPVIEVDRYSID